MDYTAKCFTKIKNYIVNRSSIYDEFYSSEANVYSQFLNK